MAKQADRARPARTRSIGTTLVGLLIVPMIALAALWGFVASTTVSKAASEYSLNRVGLGLYEKTQVMLLAFEKERATTFIWQSSPQPLPTSQLDAVRRASDIAIASFQGSEDVTKSVRQGSASQLSTIQGLRQAIDAGRLSPAAAFEQYSSIIDSVLAVFLLPAQPDTELYQRSLASLDAARTQEQLSRQIVLVEGVELDHTSLNAADRLAFADAVAVQAVELEDAIALSQGSVRTSLLGLANSTGYGELLALQNQIAGATNKAGLAEALAAWTPVSKKVYGQLQGIENAIKVPLINASGQLGRSLVLQAVLSGGLGLLALLISVFLMIRFGRRVRAELTGLRDGAQTIAHERLPRVIKELADGDEVDVAAESPPLPVGKITEVSRVAEAFSTVQRTAIDAAVGQANLRKGVSQVFLNLSLRNQSLLHRQLGLLDTLERTTEDPNALGELFRLDHLTTRMRRNAESLIILSGSTPGRGWREPVPVLDVLRAAIAEVEDYVRVEVVGESPDKVVGVAVNDVVHLIAELVENATAFSPPNTQVHLKGETVGFGVAIEVEDRGLGPAPEELEAINAKLASPGGFELPGSGQLGMYVVGQLAARHGIRVSLRPSPYGGTTAIVLLPHSIIMPRDEAGPPIPGTGPRPPAQAEVHRSWRETDAADPGESWSAALAVGSPTGRHRLDSSVPRYYPESAAEITAEVAAVPTGNGTPNGGAPNGGGVPMAGGSPNGGLEQARGPWEPPLAQEPTRVSPSSWGESPSGGGTHLGLPLRVRQANLAPQLRKQNPAEASVPPPADDPSTRTPEETLSMMSAFQDGWQRGRADSLGDQDEAPGDEPAGQPDAEPASPEAYSPVGYSPDAYSPDAYDPDGYSQEAQHAHDGEASQ
jgi:signal transduction histidine kinase